jgi:hypothetical protein
MSAACTTIAVARNLRQGGDPNARGDIIAARNGIHQRMSETMQQGSGVPPHRCVSQEEVNRSMTKQESRESCTRTAYPTKTRDPSAYSLVLLP